MEQSVASRDELHEEEEEEEDNDNKKTPVLEYEEVRINQIELQKYNPAKKMITLIGAYKEIELECMNQSKDLMQSSYGVTFSSFDNLKQAH